MDGYDAQKYELCKVRAANYELQIELCGYRIKLSGKKKEYGYFHTVDELFSFLCGYDAAKAEVVFPTNTLS